MSNTRQILGMIVVGGALLSAVYITGRDSNVSGLASIVGDANLPSILYSTTGQQLLIYGDEMLPGQLSISLWTDVDEVSLLSISSDARYLVEDYASGQLTVELYDIAMLAPDNLLATLEREGNMDAVVLGDVVWSDARSTLDLSVATFN